MQVVKANFGTFAVNSAGFGPGVIQNFLAADNQPVNSLTQTAKPGIPIVLWGSGLGPVPDDTVAPTAGDLATPIQILVGGKAAVKLYGGRAPCCSGLDQLVFTLPADAPLGCNVPVQIVTAGTISSNVTTMAISADGSPCRDEINPFNLAPLTGGRVGTVLLTRVSNYGRKRGAAPGSTADIAAATFRNYSGGNQFAFEPSYSLPPVGTCTVYTAVAPSFTDAAFRGKFYPAFAVLDAGTNLSVSTQPRTGSVLREIAHPRDYSGLLGGSLPGLSAPFLNTTETFTVAGSGGSQVGTFSVPLNKLPGITWTNVASTTVIDRSQPLRVTWEVTNPGAVGLAGYAVTIVGAATSLPENATAMFQCVAKASDGAFVVPSAILRSLPAGRVEPTDSTAVLGLGVVPLRGAVFSAANLDSGVAIMISASVATVTLQ